MTGWHRGLLAAFDLETTGVDPLTARIVTAAHITVDGATGAAETRAWIADPGVDIPAEAAAIHGYTTEKARELGQPAAEVADLVAGEVALSLRAGHPIVGHNAAYDLTVLACELARHGLPSLEERVGGPVAPVVCTFVLDKQVDKWRKGKRTLTRCCEVYDVGLDGAHDSTYDALAAARVAWRICQRHPEIAAMSLDELHEAQVGWAAEQAASLQEYFRRKDPAAVVDGAWPVRAFDPQAVAA